MYRLFNTVLLGAALMTPVMLVAQDHPEARRVYDARHKDYHNWDAHEDRAYHMYWDQQHRPYREFTAVNERDQANYWKWRHRHSDAVLRINVP